MPIRTSSPVLTDEVSAHLLALYPNPSQDSNQVVVESENPRRELTKIRVLNLKGIKMFEDDTREGSYVLNLKEYASGPLPHHGTEFTTPCNQKIYREIRTVPSTGIEDEQER